MPLSIIFHNYAISLRSVRYAGSDVRNERVCVLLRKTNHAYASF